MWHPELSRVLAWERGSGAAGHRPVAMQRATRCPWLRPGALLTSAGPTLRQADYLWWMPPWGREPFESKDSLWGQELECRRPASGSRQAPRPPQGGQVGPPRTGAVGPTGRAQRAQRAPRQPRGDSPVPTGAESPPCLAGHRRTRPNPPRHPAGGTGPVPPAAGALS